MSTVSSNKYLWGEKDLAYLLEHYLDEFSLVLSDKNLHLLPAIEVHLKDSDLNVSLYRKVNLISQIDAKLSKVLRVTEPVWRHYCYLKSTQPELFED